MAAMIEQPEQILQLNCVFCIYECFTLSVQNIRNTYLILSNPQNSLNSSEHGLYVLKVIQRDAC